MEVEDGARAEPGRREREGGEDSVKRGRGSDRSDREDRGGKAVERRAAASPRVRKAEEDAGQGVEGDMGVRQGARAGDTAGAGEGVTVGEAGAEGRRLWRKRRRQQVERDQDGGWSDCTVGAYRTDRVRVVAGVRVIRLAEVVAGRRRTEKCSRKAVRGRLRLQVVVIGGSCRLQTCETDKSGEGVLESWDSSAGAESGLSGEEMDRQQVVRRQEEKRVAMVESRRGYAIGAAWDEGNMIQAMARLKNPALAWRYGDG